MDPAPDEVQSTHSDVLLAGLLSEMTEELRHGRVPDIESFVNKSPELGQELRELWATIEVAEQLAHFSLAEPNSTPRFDPEGTTDNRPPQLEDGPGVLGDCELDEELGRGGMGIVYRARQTRLGRTVAIKILRRGLNASPVDEARFRAEASAAAHLDHPNIVPVYSVGDHDGQPYFIMRLIDGPTLARRLSEGPLPAREAAALLAPVCRAVDHAHRSGILHRDLKPSNILIDRQGRPHVADFGLAKRVDAVDAGLTISGAIVGTPAYMAPEQASEGRGPIGPRSDVYSLGAILYQMLTGRPPFQAASAIDTIFLILEQEPLSPRLLNPRADRDLTSIAMKCLQKPADLRYGSAGELADDLEAYLSGDPVSARAGRFSAVISRALSETHHAAVLENWGLLWIWHSVVVLLLCLFTNLLQEQGIRSSQPYVLIWTVGFGTWAATFWALRRRSGPVTFVERQIAHVWASSVIGCFLLFWIESLLGLPVLTLSPVLAVMSGMVFLTKAAILSGAFYIPAALMFLTSGLMALWPRFGLTIFGVTAGVGFFLPGLKYYRRQRRAVMPNRPTRKKIEKAG